jgi:putative copper export protein
MIFISLILAPALRRFPQDTRWELLRTVGTATKAAGWIAIMVLLFTGLLNILHLQIQWNTLIGRLLMIKLALVAVMIILSALHDFILGPLLVARQRTPAPHQPSISRLRRLVPWLARINLLLALGVIYLAVLIARS